MGVGSAEHIRVLQHDLHSTRFAQAYHRLWASGVPFSFLPGLPLDHCPPLDLLAVIPLPE